MSWFSRRKPSRGKEKPEGLYAPRGLASGLHRSPGLALLSKEMAKRPPRAILDLGSSSTETVSFLSRFCDNISIQDLFQSADPGSGTRSSVFRFDEATTLGLPGERERFDVILIWDLLHYFAREHLAGFADRLAERCHEGALVYLLASAITPIPLTPIRFKIHGEEMLDYHLPSADRAASPQLRTRDVEQVMARFEPVRLFQLRNGLQEFLFRSRSSPEAEVARL